MYSTNTSPADPTIMSPTPSLSRSDVAATDVPRDLTWKTSSNTRQNPSFAQPIGQILHSGWVVS